jgi:preprotein translocase subunit SecB
MQKKKKESLAFAILHNIIHSIDFEEKKPHCNRTKNTKPSMVIDKSRLLPLVAPLLFAVGIVVDINVRSQRAGSFITYYTQVKQDGMERVDRYRYTSLKKAGR